MTKERKTRVSLGYCAVREWCGEECLDVQTLRGSRREAERRAAEIETLTPQWAKDYPVIRITKVRVEEIHK